MSNYSLSDDRLIQVSAVIAKPTHEALQAIAEREKRSFSFVVRSVLEDHVAAEREKAE